MDITLENLKNYFPADFTDDEKANAQTIFYKNLALRASRFYAGKMQVMPKVGVWGQNWFNVWYTPGVSAVSTSIRDNQNESYQYSNKGNSVAIVTDSTRVLGDGNCGVCGGLGVMDGKALLMKYLAGIDATPLCVNNRLSDGRPSPEKLIDFVKMVEPSFGAINLEDISKPNCYKVLDTLREECQIPVWHDDAQGTACVILAGLINAIKLAGKTFESCKFVLLGAGAANSTVARFIMQQGALESNVIMFDSKGALDSDRVDLKDDVRGGWLCQHTNHTKVKSIEDAINQADVLVALSKSGPDTVKSAWIKSMAPKAIVFVCANPVPEIYPHQAKAAGAYIVATGRGDFPNQVNNSVCFPGILKGALLVHASKITDNMAIRAAQAIAAFADKRGISPENIVPTMEEIDVFPAEAAEVADQAVLDGVARRSLSYNEVYELTKYDILNTRSSTESLIQNGLILSPPENMVIEALNETIKTIKNSKCDM